jgi:predicted CXXCH cytochrome family protein
LTRLRRVLPAIAAAVLSLAASGWAGPRPAEDCLVCHADKDLKSSRGRSVFVDQAAAEASIHGQIGLTCSDCHTDLKAVKDFPHAETLKPVDCASCHSEAAAKVGTSVHRAAPASPNAPAVGCKDCHGSHAIRGKDDAQSSVYALNIPETCESCHLERVKTKNGRAFIEQYNGSVHYQALAKKGLSQAATCVTCHGGHDVLPAASPESRVARKSVIRTCGRCHVGIERGYLEGVHGKDYVKGLKDVPVCTDCHGEHGIQAKDDLTSLVYATRVAGVCARCHDDERLARQYGFLTSRLKTYSNSFHGTASKFGETKVANCASCHGFHDIRTSTDPKSSIHPANLAVTCGRCHPGAGANFAKGKIHVVSERKEAKGAYLAKVFYLAAIGGLISAFLIFIAADIYRRARTRWHR